MTAHLRPLLSKRDPDAPPSLSRWLYTVVWWTLIVVAWVAFVSAVVA
jgi:hypothetical protein